MTRPRLRLLTGVCLALAVALAPSCRREQPQLTLQRRPIINGVVDTTHPSVVALVYTAYGTMEQFCTGTVIGTRWVLTAGHCYKESGFPPAQTKVFFGQTVASGGTVVNVSNAYVHPQYYLATNGAPVNDVCVVELAQDAPSPPMAWQQTALGSIVGQTVTLVGYGVTNAQAQTGNGTRRTVDEVVNDEDTMYVYYGGGTSGTCQGDSGGPMFMHGTTETVVGVTSFGDQSCVQLGANTRVDVFADFIKQYVGTGPQPVTVSFTQPQNGATVAGTVAATVSAQSGAGVTKVDLYLDGAQQGTVTSAPYSFTLTGVATGAHTLRAVATAADGGSGEASVSVTVTAALQCSAQNPCSAGYDCVDGQCVARTPITPGSPGASCTQNTECQSGICVDGSTTHGFCSELCTGDQDCHNQAACFDMGDGTLLCGPAYSAELNPPGAHEVTGGCRAAPAPAARLPLAALVLLALALARRRR